MFQRVIYTESAICIVFATLASFTQLPTLATHTYCSCLSLRCVPLYGRTTFCVAFHLLVGIWVVSCLGWLAIGLLGTISFRSLWGCSFSSSTVFYFSTKIWDPCGTHFCVWSEVGFRLCLLGTSTREVTPSGETAVPPSGSVMFSCVLEFVSGFPLAVLPKPLGYCLQDSAFCWVIR